MINSNNKQAISELLKTTEYKNKEDILKTTEYREQFNFERLNSNKTRTQTYVSKRANAESDFWKGGKFAYEDKKIQEEVVYKTNSRADFKGDEIPENFKTAEHNMRKTRMSEYSNAMFNGQVFKNPSYMSC